MNMPDQPDQTPKPGSKDQTEIAKWIILCSGLLLIALTITLIWLKGVEGSNTAFNMLVPMIGTWIGTVIAYYFSGKNFQLANDSVSKMMGHVLEDKLKAIPVKEAMIPRATMTVVKLPASSDGSTIPLQTELLDRYNDTITRLPVLDDKDAAKYIIHQSEVFEFVTRKTAAQSPASPVDLAKLTLKDFLDFDKNADFVSKTMGFVAISQTLAEAKAKMEAIPDCQDVFVTEDGDKTKPVRGWLPNVEIAKRAKV